MRQKLRLIVAALALMLFPVTMNYLSPYVSLDGALIGVMSGSLLVFLILFISGLFFGRAWCAWICPMAGLSELSNAINKKNVPVRTLAIIRYAIFTVWFGLIITFFILAGGIRGIDPLHLTERLVSVDEPLKYVVYYIVLFLFFGLNIAIGKRAACHAVCWMSPFLVGGFLAGKMLRMPQLRVMTMPARCTKCKICNSKCPMSINVAGEVESGEINSLDCILCGQCVDGCPHKVLHFKVRRWHRRT